MGDHPQSIREGNRGKQGLWKLGPKVSEMARFPQVVPQGCPEQPHSLEVPLYRAHR